LRAGHADDRIRNLPSDAGEWENLRASDNQSQLRLARQLRLYDDGARAILPAGLR
jgi:hypothetical protein